MHADHAHIRGSFALATWLAEQPLRLLQDKSCGLASWESRLHADLYALAYLDDAPRQLCCCRRCHCAC
jgi:hypothetical protein